MGDSLSYLDNLLSKASIIGEVFTKIFDKMFFGSKVKKETLV